MHVLNVSIKHVIGGTPQVCFDYTNALRSLGVEVTALIRADDPFYDLHKKLGATPVPSKFIGKFGTSEPFSLMYLAAILKNISPDVIIAHDGRAVRLCKAASLGKIPVVDVNHGRPVRQSKGTNGTIVINPRQLERTKAELSGKDNLYYVPNMVDVFGKRGNSGLKEWRNPPVIGAMGRMVDEKAFDVLIDALAILKNHNIPYKAVIGGDGQKRAELEAQLKVNKLQDLVQLVGWVDNPEEFYKSIDIFCLSSRSEACPKVLLEAMKYGLPVVVTDAEGPVDIIKNGHDGLMVQKNNPEALAMALKQMLEDRKVAAICAKNAYDKIIENYSVSVIGEKLNSILSQVVKSFRKESV